MKKISLILVLFVFLGLSAERVLLVDYASTVIDEVQRKSFLNLFSDDLSKYKISSMVLFDDDIQNIWNDKQLLVERYGTLEYDRMIVFKYYVFGERFIMRMSVFNFKTLEFERNEEFALENPEELKPVCKRAVLVFTQNKTVDQLVEVGLLSQDEIKSELSDRRSGLMGFTGAFGYMWTSPLTTDGLYAGDYRKVLMLSGSILMEVSKNARMDINFELPVAASIALSAGYIYIAKPTTFSPYWGGDIGVEYVYNRKEMYPNASIGGIFFKPRLGMLMMNTYNLSTYVESGFRLVLTDFLDSGLEVKIGLILRQ
ncbi:MAG: hypothetical protein AB7T10_03360 [bacterium]